MSRFARDASWFASCADPHGEWPPRRYFVVGVDVGVGMRTGGIDQVNDSFLSQLVDCRVNQVRAFYADYRARKQFPDERRKKIAVEIRLVVEVIFAYVHVYARYLPLAVGSHGSRRTLRITGILLGIQAADGSGFR